jgi:deoxyribonuclease-4
MRAIGLHIRLDDGLDTVVHRVQELQLTTLQCFLLDQVTQKFIEPTAQEAQTFIAATAHITQRFVHASYWTNLAHTKPTSVRFVQREIELAKRLGFTHIIFHPGYAKGATDRMQGIEALVRRLNFMLRKEDDIQIVLENSAHSNLSIGGNVNDFKAILERLEHPEKVRFCLDTVHAHAYGYDLQSLYGQQVFLQAIERTIGLEHVALIHLNNTTQQCGSYIDEHVLLDQGTIALHALQLFVQQPALAAVPIIMEMPAATLADEERQLALVRSWV